MIPVSAYFDYLDFEKEGIPYIDKMVPAYVEVHPYMDRDTLIITLRDLTLLLDYGKFKVCPDGVDILDCELSKETIFMVISTIEKFYTKWDK